MSNRLRTYMSPVYFRTPANPTTERSVTLHPLKSNDEQKCLFDDLLGGGIVIPKSVLKSANAKQPAEKNPGLFTLLVGPPGSGKSTFALEFCYRLATNQNPDLKDGEGNQIAQDGISSIYFSAESTTSDIIEQARSFGWIDDSQTSKRIVPWSASNNCHHPCVLVFGRDKAPTTKGLQPDQYFTQVQNNWRNIVRINFPKIVIFDSLNVLPKRWRPQEVLEVLVRECLPGPLMMVAMLDLHVDSSQYSHWLYMADLTIELSYRKEEDYLVRKIQIVKARHQDHADGEHRLKINAKPSPDEDVRHPMSPLIKEGGIFVFPSVHRVLSRARRRSKIITKRLRDPLPTPFKALNDIVHSGGLHAGSCTAIVGSRGGMKSHLAYYTMLKFLDNFPEERALLISLRDEEESYKQTLVEILTNQLSDEGKPWRNVGGNIREANRLLDNYLDKDRLEILFFWPGYVSPEEFFHLVEVSLDRSPPGKKPVSLVVINGLEQLNARFPLCANEKMFVSGLVTMLTVCGTTSIVVSGGSFSLPPDKGGVPAGLLQMSDLIIESSFQLLPKNRVWSDELWPREPEWKTVLRDKQYQPDPVAIQDEPHVVYQIIREPGARECRRRALFYMGRAGDELPLKEGSVNVRLLPDNFPYGKAL